MSHIYLDNNATTLIDEAVVVAMNETLLEAHANPASQHGPGRAARRKIEQCREEIGRLLDIRSSVHQTDQMIFTSGGTESNNLAIFGLAGEATVEDPGRIIVSSIEHPSLLEAARRQSQLGFDVQFLSVNRHGVCDVAELESLINDQTRLVSVMWGNNETGVLQPVKEIAAICRQHDVLFHCDAVQCIGKIPVSFRELDAAAMTFSPHKFHGPVGVGGLIVRHDVSLAPTLFGGAQQYALRPGTESVSLAVGTATAIRIATEDSDRGQRMTVLRDRFEQRVTESIADCVIIGSKSTRLPHTSNISFPGVDRQAFLMAADLADVAISSGSACSSGSSERSHVLTAMGLKSDIVDGALRISLSACTTDEEIDAASDRIIRIANDLR